MPYLIEYGCVCFGAPLFVYLVFVSWSCYLPVLTALLVTPIRQPINFKQVTAQLLIGRSFTS